MNEIRYIYTWRFFTATYDTIMTEQTHELHRKPRADGKKRKFGLKLPITNITRLKYSEARIVCREKSWFGLDNLVVPLHLHLTSTSMVQTEINCLLTVNGYQFVFENLCSNRNIIFEFVAIVALHVAKMCSTPSDAVLVLKIYAWVTNLALSGSVTVLETLSRQKLYYSPLFC